MQTLNPSEISELIKSRIEKVKLAAEARNEGTVTSVSDGIVRIHGLADVMQGEMIELPNNTFALALNLERDSVGSVVLGDYEHLREGDVAKTTGRILEVPIGPELLGRVVNALGEPIDGDAFARFVGLLLDNRRLALLPEISGLFDELRFEAERVVKARVTSATALPAGELDTLKAALRKRFGREVEVETAVDESLIGGAVIDAGDVVIDGSLRGKLGRLQAALSN